PSEKATAVGDGAGPPGPDGAAAGPGSAATRGLSAASGRRAGPHLQREPGGERLPLFRQALWAEGGCDRPVGGGPRLDAAAGGAGSGADVWARTGPRRRNREEAQLTNG